MATLYQLRRRAAEPLPTFVEEPRKKALGSDVHRIEPFIFLYITEKCQLRCQHCYVGDRLDREEFMPVERVHAILRSMRITYGHYKVYLLGGEPTIHPELPSILEACRAEKYHVVLTSNGLFPERQWDLLTKERLDEISFSLDGATAETHESVRGKNTHEPLMRNLRRATTSGLRTRIIMTVMRRNVGEVPQLLDLADEIGLSTVSLHYFTPTGLGQVNAAEQLPPEEWMAFTEQVKAKAKTMKASVFYPPAFVRAAKVGDTGESELDRLSSVGYRGCTARNLERVAIFPDGRVYICSAFFDTDLHYGELVNGRLVPRVGGGGELELVNKVSDNCGTCKSSSACRGGCAAYDHFDRTYPADRCDREIVPICPLWSTAAVPATTSLTTRELR